MILRRIAEHVRTQNWTAIALDFVIVVVGVFMGIQLGNWNEARALKAQERSYLVLLHEELLENAERSALLLDYYTTVTDAGNRALAYLKGSEECEVDCEGLLIDFFHASQVWAIAFEQTAFREAIELGFPSENALRDKLFATYNFTDSFGFINQASPPFRETIREYIEPDAARILWSGCWEVDEAGVSERLMRSCADQLKAVDSAGMLQEIKSDPRLKGMLRYSLTQNYVAMQNYPTMRDRTMATANLVAAEIETVR
ncbi:MAG: hypothetical protein AAF668_05805 [Pseudomonadota bacterium]